jgi:hypothetical protein
VYFADQELNLEHQCGTMLELRLNIPESKILHSYKNHGNTKYKVFIFNSAVLKNLQIDCYLPCKSTKVKTFYSFLMLARRTNITENKIVLR